MKPEDHAWLKLVASARRVRDDRDAAAPYGFAARVVAVAFTGEKQPTGAALLERLSWRALGVAALLALASVAANYSSFTGSADEDMLSDDATIAALFDVS